MSKLSFAEFMAEDRRLVILRSLNEAMEYNLNEQVIKTALHHIGHNVGADIVRAELVFLRDHQLVRIEEMPMQRGDLWIVTLTEKGQMVARGQYHPGVARLQAS